MYRLLLVIVPFVFIGCASHGPPQLRQGQLAYNCALKATVDEEILLNIVRLRYLDTIEFLSASSISSQSEISVGLGGSVGDFGGLALEGVTGNVGWATRPTFTFTPQRGHEFAKRLMGPLDLSLIAYLASSNWDLEKLLRLTIAKMSGVSSDLPGEAQLRFVEITSLLQRLQDRGMLRIGTVEQTEIISGPLPAESITPSDYMNAADRGYRFVPSDDGATLSLTKSGSSTAVLISPGTAEASRLAELLDLEPRPRPYFTIDIGEHELARDDASDLILVRTRSLLTAMAHLAQGVHPPPAHLSAGLTSAEWPVAGARAQQLRGFFQVRASASRPSAGLAVPYRGHWFYLSDCDQDSKGTFLVFATLYRLGLSEAVTAQAPVLTLPVGN